MQTVVFWNMKVGGISQRSPFSRIMGPRQTLMLSLSKCDVLVLSIVVIKVLVVENKPKIKVKKKKNLYVGERKSTGFFCSRLPDN